MKYKYKVFISYRHVSPDTDIAIHLQRLLESHNPLFYSKKNVWRVFRDETELPACSDLGKGIRNALLDSEYLICICSREYVKSRWCKAEIEYFKQIHEGSLENIACILVDGNPKLSFPKELFYSSVKISDDYGAIRYKTVPMEPLAANITASTVRESLKKLKTEYLRVVAMIMHCGYDDLYQRDLKRRIKNRRLLFSIFFAALSIISIVSAFVANEFRLKNKMLLEENSRYLSAQSKNIYEEGDLAKALEYTVESLPSNENNGTTTTEARYIASEELGLYREENLFPEKRFTSDSPVTDVVLSSNGKVALIETRKNIYIWSTETGELLNNYNLSNLDSKGTELKLLYLTNPLVESVDIMNPKRFAHIETEDGLGTVLYSSQKTIQKDKSFERIFLMYDDLGNIWRISSKTGDIIWKSENKDFESIMESEVVFSEDGLYRYVNISSIISYDEENLGDYIEKINFDTGETISVVDIDNEFSEDYEYISDSYIVKGNYSITYIDKLQKEFESIKISHVFGGDELIGKALGISNDNLYTLEELNGGALGNAVIHEFDCIAEKETWATRIHGGFSRMNRIINVSKESTGNFSDFLIVISDKYISVLDKISGELLRELEAPGSISSSYYSENGYLFFVSTGSKAIYCIPLLNLNEFDGVNRAVIYICEFVTPCELFSYGNDCYVTASENGYDVYAYRWIENQFCSHDAEADNKGYYMGKPLLDECDVSMLPVEGLAIVSLGNGQELIVGEDFKFYEFFNGVYTGRILQLSSSSTVNEFHFEDYDTMIFYAQEVIDESEIILAWGRMGWLLDKKELKPICFIDWYNGYNYESNRVTAYNLVNDHFYDFPIYTANELSKIAIDYLESMCHNSRE